MHSPSLMLYFGLKWSEQLRVALSIELTDEQDSELTSLARSRTASFRLAQRARMVLLAAQGMQNSPVCMHSRLFCRVMGTTWGAAGC